MQAAGTMYSCVVLALSMLTAFCPGLDPKQAKGEWDIGWPQIATLRSLQKQCHALSLNHVPATKRGKALGKNLKGCLLLTSQLLDRMHVPLSEHQAKDVAASQQQRKVS